MRYADGDADAWARRTGDLDRLDQRDGGVVLGAAIHSVRAVPAEHLATVREAAQGRPLHVHLSEQVAENDACLEAYGVTPTRLLADARRARPADHRGPRHPPDRRRRRRLLGASRTRACFCPTTERDLGDGIGPSRAARRRAPLTLGSDSHAVIDLFEEMRAVELDERLATRRARPLDRRRAARGGHGRPATPASGSTDAGAIAVGQRADLVTLDAATPRTAGTGADENTVGLRRGGRGRHAGDGRRPGRRTTG